MSAACRGQDAGLWPRSREGQGHEAEMGGGAVSPPLSAHRRSLSHLRFGLEASCIFFLLKVMVNESGTARPGEEKETEG